MKNYIAKYKIALVLAAALWCGQIQAQNTQTLTLEQAINAAADNNHLIKIKNLQAEEQKAKIKEINIKKYPLVNVFGSYLYNVNVGNLRIPAGSIQVPMGGAMLGLPLEDINYAVGKHHGFNAGAMIYQPLTQLPKIKTGINVAEHEYNMAKVEAEQVRLKLSNGVEKLYYAILIAQKQKLEAQKRIEVANLKLYDLESALLAGKTIDMNEAGLNAAIADEEQKLLKLDFQEEDYRAELRALTHLPIETMELQEVALTTITTSVEDLKAKAEAGNIEIQLANMQKTKAQLGMKAAKQSNLPDVGLVGGYAFQTNLDVLPKNNIFLGANLIWNLQGLMTNKSTYEQRSLMAQQAEEHIKHLQEETAVNVEKIDRKLRQATALVEVAQKAVNYRKKDLKFEEDRLLAGNSTKIKVLEAEANLAKSESDLYAAQLSYKLALIDLKMLLGNSNIE